MNPKQIWFSDISLRCMIRAVAREWWTVVASALILAMGISLYFSWFFTPVYQGNVTYAVRSRRTTQTSTGNAISAKEIASPFWRAFSSFISRSTTALFSTTVISAVAAWVVAPLSTVKTAIPKRR